MALAPALCLLLAVSVSVTYDRGEVQLSGAGIVLDDPMSEKWEDFRFMGIVVWVIAFDIW